MVMVPLPAATSNTVPSPMAPPPQVVPKRLPLLSSTRPPMGLAPLVPLKEARVVMVPLPAATLEHRAVSRSAPPLEVVPKRLPLLSSTRPAGGVLPVGAVEGCRGW